MKCQYHYIEILTTAQKSKKVTVKKEWYHNSYKHDEDVEIFPCPGELKVNVENDIDYGTMWEEGSCSCSSRFNIEYKCRVCGNTLRILDYDTRTYERLTDLPDEAMSLESFLQKIVDERE